MADQKGKNTGSQDTSIYGVDTHDPRNISDAAEEEALDTAEGMEDEDVLEDRTPKAKLGTENNPIRGEDSGNETLDEASIPSSRGEQSISGDMPDPSSDDDTLASEHQVGLRQNETEENREELDIASDRDKAENYHKSH